MIFEDMELKHDSEYLFYSENKVGEHISYGFVRKKLDELVIDAGLSLENERINPHSIRHLYARKFNRLYPQKKILLSGLIGHASVKTTELYLKSGH